MIPFVKYHGTGNDFILIDDRDSSFDENNHVLIAAMCHRRFGIGADGLILLRSIDGFDFQMVYFNSDGSQSSMCGNGGRCIVHFAHSLGLFDSNCTFKAIDGLHHASISEAGIVKLQMNDVSLITRDGDAYVLDTGSPHYVCFVEDISELDVSTQGASIRYSDKYQEHGINVNFVASGKNDIHVATYERGVEDETYSCGTGVTAAAIAFVESNNDFDDNKISISTKGGKLMVHLQKDNNQYHDIWLEGPATPVFQGVFE